jgi:folylpolyglutamate synthase/dihydropteroate synthase
MKHDNNKKAKNSHAGVVHTDDVKAKSSIVAAETMSKLKQRLQFNSEFEETNSPYPGFLRQQRAKLSNVSLALTLAHFTTTVRVHAQLLPNLTSTSWPTAFEDCRTRDILQPIRKTLIPVPALYFDVWHRKRSELFEQAIVRRERGYSNAS